MKTVCVDFDGVLAQYDGWKGVEVIGEPIKGAVEFTKWLKDRSKVVIYTVRANDKRGLVLVKEWLDKHGFHYDDIYIGSGKPLCAAFVDDRAVNCSPQRTFSSVEEFKSTLQEVEYLIATEK